MEPAPQPSGPPPEGWLEIQWVAYCMLMGGSPQRTVASVVDRSTGTISGWIKKWRERYGSDLLKAQVAANRSEIQRRPGPEREEAHALGLAWKNERTGTAPDAAKTGVKATKIVADWLDMLAEDPDKLRNLEAKDVRFISKIASESFANADRLADIAHPDRMHGARLVNKGQIITGGGTAQQVQADLSKLAGAATADNVVELRDKLIATADNIQRRREIIEAHEAADA